VAKAASLLGQVVGEKKEREREREREREGEREREREREREQGLVETHIEFLPEILDCCVARLSAINDGVAQLGPSPLEHRPDFCH
jgi:hypothetical protein